MKTLRLLLWLRLKLFLRGNSAGNRIASVVVPLLLLLVFSPVWIGAAVAAYAAARGAGTPGVTLVFGLGHLAWIWLGLLIGAMGRTFDLDALARWPVRPRTVFALNVVASLLSPVPLMVLTALGATVAGAFARGGAVAAAGVALGALGLLLVTATLLQVLLALLDELLRRESVRYAATAVTTLTIVGLQIAIQVSARSLARGTMLRVANHEVSLQQALAGAAGFFAHVPTVAAPVALAGGALDHAWGRAALGLAGTLALLAAGLLPGAALMRRSVRAARGDEGRRTDVRAPGGAASFAAAARVLPRGVGLLLARELRYTLRIPQRLMSVVLAPVVAIAYFLATGRQAEASTGFVFALLCTSVATSSVLLFGYDGAGIRSTFLLPCRPRDVLLAKNLELLLRIALQGALLGIGLGVFAPGLWSPLNVSIAVAALAVVMVVLSVGTAMSIRHPSRARRRGLQSRGGGGLATLAVYGGMIGGALVIGAAIWGVRRLAGGAADAAGLVVALAALALAGAVWWRALDRCAPMLPENRERLIATLAHGEE